MSVQYRKVQYSLNSTLQYISLPYSTVQYSRVQYSTVPWYGCELAGEVFSVRTGMVKGRKEPAEEMKESIWVDDDSFESIWTDRSTPALLQKVSQKDENLVPG